MGKETVLVKSVNAETPSDFVRTEYVEFGDDFDSTLAKYLESLEEQAEHYETVADQLEKNPILALDYLHRAYLITGDTKLRKKARAVLKQAKLQERAANSVELLAASF